MISGADESRAAPRCQSSTQSRSPPVATTYPGHGLPRPASPPSPPAESDALYQARQSPSPSNQDTPESSSVPFCSEARGRLPLPTTVSARLSFLQNCDHWALAMMARLPRSAALVDSRNHLVSYSITDELVLHHRARGWDQLRVLLEAL